MWAGYLLSNFKTKVMKKITLLLLLIANLSAISCTEQSITEEVNSPKNNYATDGESDPKDPGDIPIGG